MLTLAEAMLQIKHPRGSVESSHHQTEELSVTQSEYESAAEREYAEQEILKYWYDNNVGYLRLTNLIPQLLDLMDNGKIAFSVGVELSYLDEEKQYVLLGLIKELDCTPSYAQANRMHKDFIAGILTDNSIEEMLSADKPNQRPAYKVSAEKLSQFIKPDTPPKQAEEFIIKACDHYAKFLKRQRNRDANNSNTCVVNLIKAIKEFQRRTGLEPDGCTGAKTLAMLKKYGFTE